MWYDIDSIWRASMWLELKLTRKTCWFPRNYVDSCLAWDKAPTYNSKVPLEPNFLPNHPWHPTVQPEPDFSWTCGFPNVLNNVKPITYMKCQKMLMTGCREMGKKYQKYPQNGFSPFVIPIVREDFLPSSLISKPTPQLGVPTSFFWAPTSQLLVKVYHLYT